MIFRPFTFEKDYLDVAKWWTAWSWPTIAPSSLSTTGFVVEDATHKYCAGWIYKTNSDIAWIEFIVANPETEKELRKEALEYLISQLSEEAHRLGFRALFTSLKSESLKSKYKKLGYQETDTNMTNFIRIQG